MGDLIPFVPETLPEVKKLTGGGGGGSSMEERVARLEENVGQIKVDIADIKAQIPHLATKAELHDLKASLIQWMVGMMLASAGLAAAIAFGLARLIKG